MISRHPLPVLLCAGLLMVLALAVTLLPIRIGNWKVGPLTFQSNRNALVSEELEWNSRFIEWEGTFPGSLDVYVVVDLGMTREQKGYDGRLKLGKAAVEDLAPALVANHVHVQQVVWGFSPKQFSPRAIRLAPMTEFSARLEQVRQAQPLLEAQSLAQLINPARGGGQQGDRSGELLQFTGLLQAVNQTLENPQQHFDLERALGGADLDNQWEYLISDNGRMLFLRVTPKSEAGGISAFEPAVDSIRTVVDQVALGHRQVAIGVTGAPTLEVDETRAAENDGYFTSILAFLLIYVLLALANHSIRGPVLVMVPLLFAIAWAMGFATLTVGHLQVISVVFTVPLLGLGIEYGIYLQARYEMVRHQFPDDEHGFRLALVDSFQTMGPGVITGAITTAVAFVTTMFTDFKGVAEMGEIAGGGVLLCMLAMFSVFPALLRIFRSSHRHVRPPQSRRLRFFDERWVMPFVRKPVLTLALGALLLAASGWAISKMTFDYDLMKLQPRNAPSVIWEERVAHDSGETMWTAISLVGGENLPLEQALNLARERAKQFRALPTVRKVGGIGLLFPEDDQEKIALLQAMQREFEPALQSVLGQRPAPAAATAPAAAAAPLSQPATGLGAATAPATQPDLMMQLTLIRQLLALGSLAGPKMTPQEQAAMEQLQATIDRTLQILGKLPVQERQQRLAALEEDYRNSRYRIAEMLGQMFDLGPLTPADLPAELLAPYRGPEGRLSLEIYPKVPEGKHKISGPLDPEFLPRFMRDVESIDPKITGVITQIYRSGALIANAYLQAGAMALVAVFLLVALDFFSFFDAFVTLVPVAVGFAATFGVLYLSDMGINPANIIVLPLMFGIGVDSGVQIIHRYRMDPTGQPPGLTAGTGKGVTVTNMATVVGFGVLMLAQHRGIVSLGFVLSVGMALTMIACWTVMPAWLELRNRRLRHKRPH